MSTSARQGDRPWRRRLALYAIIAALVGLVVLFVGPSVAPCLGITPETRSSCVEAWEAQKGVFQRLYDSFGPWSFAIATFLGLVLATAAVELFRGRR